MQIRYVILNGPPSSGKSNIARELAGVFNQRDGDGTAIIDSFAAPLKHFYASALGTKHIVLVHKTVPMPELNGYTLRQCWIDLAENYIKKRFGEEIFARWLIYRSLRPRRQGTVQKKPHYCIIDDGGFIPEIEAIPNRMVVAVSRPMTDWGGDSRGYYPKPDELFHNVGNSLAGLWKHAEQLAAAVEKYKWQ